MQVPSPDGFLCLYSSVPLLLMTPSSGPNWTLYVSPPPISRSMQPSVPRFGGSTSTAAILPSAVALIWNVPLGVFLMFRPLIGPLSYFGSLYLKPFTESPLQNGLPVDGLVPV